MGVVHTNIEGDEQSMGFQTKIIICFLSMLGCVSVMTTGVVAILYQNNLQFVNNETIKMQQASGNLYVMRFGTNTGDICDAGSTNSKQYPCLLYKDSEIVDAELFKDFTRSSTFSDYQESLGDARKMEYLFKYELSSTLTEETTYITLVNAELNQINPVTKTDLGIRSDMYDVSYRYAFNYDEPDVWDDFTSKSLSEYTLTNNTNTETETRILEINKENTVVWIRVCLFVKNRSIESGSGGQTSSSSPGGWRPDGSSRDFQATRWSFTLYFGNELNSLQESLSAQG